MYFTTCLPAATLLITLDCFISPECNLHMFILCIFLQLLASLNPFQSSQSIQLTWQILSILQLWSEFIGWYLAQARSSAQCMVYTVEPIHCHSTLLPLSLITWFESELNMSADILPKLCNQLNWWFMLWIPSHLPDIPQLWFFLCHLHLTQWPMEDYFWLECINWCFATSWIISPICMFRYHASAKPLPCIELYRAV